MMRRLRTAGPAVAAAAVVALAAAGCGSKTAPLARGAVPWVDLPGQFFEPSPLPAHRRPADARPCTASQVRVSPDGGNGATGHLFAYFAFRNISRATCILRGYPPVVASEPGKPGVTAAHSGWFADSERSGNMRPGGVTMLSIETDRDCPARYANPNQYPALIYQDRKS